MCAVVVAVRKDEVVLDIFGDDDGWFERKVPLFTWIGIAAESCQQHLPAIALEP